ncbi:putative short-chain dehydrogenase [Hyaloscypha variabilis F]|uniref:Putative short-chain dehydrogenase n=1 Tax=Hyaloscypha variabilis (strain UAMH 11265 / GT02V1 / F) TaxID=1149755 RepID=A0A2J6RNU2_HYAVF|nr:putative short-chain dehydrogenase [Hyaloscypha variabilis F]
MPSLIGLLRLFKLPFISLATPAPETFKGKTILITGAASGIGLAAAQHFAHFGASRIILGVRSLRKGNAAAQTLLSTSSNADLRVDSWELDLMSFESVVKFSEKCKRDAGRIDVAIMNAGKASTKFELSPDGWESLMQVNVLSTAFLSCLLLSQLVTTSKKTILKTGDGLGGVGLPHFVIVGSDAHYQVEFRERNEKDILAALNTERSFKGHEFDRYCVSKLFDLYIAVELAALVPRVKGSPIVVVNCVTPGFCASGLLAQSGEPPLILRVLQWLVARTPEKGALCYVDAASKGEESHGQYLNHQKVWKPGELATSEEGVELRAKVWSEILDELEKIRPDTRSLLAFHDEIWGT